MTKLYSRMFPVIIILIIEMTIATAALTNVWAAVAFYAQKGGSASQEEMYYVAVNDYTGGNINGISIAKIYFPMYIVALISLISGSVISTGISFILIALILLLTLVIFYWKSDRIFIMILM